MPDASRSATADYGRALEVGERGRLMRDGLINYSSLLVSGVVGILLVPVMLRGLGAESYGLWIAALSVAGMAGVLDLGLGWSVTREVAAARSDETARFVAAARKAYVVVGIVGAVLIAAFGLLLSGGLQLPAGIRGIAPIIFLLAGLGFFAEQLLLFSSAVLGGLRRFGIDNLVSIAVTLLRAGGIVALLGAGAALVPVAGWQVVATNIMAFLSLGVVGRLEPRFRLLGARSEWGSLRAHLPYGLTSQLASAASAVLWQAAPILIGMVGGSASIVPYHIGQKFPLAASAIIGRAAAVFFPAASEHERAQNMERSRQVLEVSTRWPLVLALPLCLCLWILAPNLLRAWLGEARPDTVLVLRLTTAAVFADAVGVGALHVLWGRGAARTVLAVLVGVTMGSVGLSLALLLRLGAVGAAWGQFVPVTLGSFAFLYLASRACGVRVSGLIRASSQGVLFPAVACAATAFATAHLARPERWAGVLAAGLVTGASYAVSLYLRGAREEERILAEEAVRLPATISRLAYRGLQRALRRLGLPLSGI